MAGIAYTSMVLSIVVTLFILFYRSFTYTSLFSCIRNSKHVTNIRKRSVSKSRQKLANEVHHSLITDNSIDILRYDDIMDMNDISISDTDYHHAESCFTQNSGLGPTTTVVEINIVTELY